MQELDPSVADYLTALTERAQSILGANLVGVFAAGSLALDAYEHGRSDIDIAIVCAGAMALPVKQTIVGALRHEALPCPARGLELVVYRSAVAGAGRPDPGFEVELNTGPRMSFRATWAGVDRQAADGTFWYAIDRSILAERGVALLGPPAGAVFRSVPDDELIALLIASLRWHLGLADESVPDPEFEDDGSGDASWTADAVLNACRAWRRVLSGHWSSKRDAGREVLSLSDSGDLDHAVVEQALAARHGAAPPSVRAARAFQLSVLGRLERMIRR